MSMSVTADKFNQSKLTNIASRASSFMSTAMSLEHLGRRAALMKRAKALFTNNMTGPMNGISFALVSALSAFFESVVDYDSDTAGDADAMGKIWDVMANMPAVAEVVNFNKTEEGKRVTEEEKARKEEEKRQKEAEKRQKEAEKQQKEAEKQKKAAEKQKKENDELKGKYLRTMKRLKENKEMVKKLMNQIKNKEEKIKNDENAAASMEDKFLELMMEIPESEDGSKDGSKDGSEDSSKDGSEESADPPEESADEEFWDVSDPEEFDGGVSDPEESAPIVVPEPRATRGSKKRKIN